MKRRDGCWRKITMDMGSESLVAPVVVAKRQANELPAEELQAEVRAYVAGWWRCQMNSGLAHT